MAIKIVTDSTCDLPASLVKKLGVVVVPEYLRFGDKVYRDQIDITEDQFYDRLVNGSVHPMTAQPTPQDFSKVYKALCGQADSVISIHLSSKLSGTYQSAAQASTRLPSNCVVEVVDSQSVSVAMGLMVIQAARMARSGMTVKQIVAELGRLKANVHMLILFDTLKYLAKGGRIGKAKALLGSLLNIKPLLMIKNGELVPSSQVRTRSKGTDFLLDFARKAVDIQDLAVLYSTTPDEAKALIERLNSVFPKEQVILSRLGSALGVHGGPGVLAVALREKGE